jgi:hypothetical protein
VFSTQKNGTITLTIRSSGKVEWRFSKTSRPLLRVTRTSAGSSSSAPTASTAGIADTRVYVTETGECYHRGDCQYLSHSKIPISLKEAKARGYRPCSVCEPT